MINCIYTVYIQIYWVDESIHFDRVVFVIVISDVNLMCQSDIFS